MVKKSEMLTADELESLRKSVKEANIAARKGIQWRQAACGGRDGGRAARR